MFDLPEKASQFQSHDLQPGRGATCPIDESIASATVRMSGEGPSGRLLGGRYALSAQQRIGAQATVTQAFDMQASRMVAIKRVRFGPNDARARESFQREASMLRDQYDPLAELSKRAEKGSLTLTKGRQREFYFLVQDDELAVMSNRPFLGEVSRRSGFVCVDGVVTRRPELVEEIRRLAFSPPEPERRARR